MACLTARLTARLTALLTARLTAGVVPPDLPEFPRVLPGEAGVGSPRGWGPAGGSPAGDDVAVASSCAASFATAPKAVFRLSGSTGWSWSSPNWGPAVVWRFLGVPGVPPTGVRRVPPTGVRLWRARAAVSSCSSSPGAQIFFWWESRAVGIERRDCIAVVAEN